jgi:hypothetical protein
VALPVLTVGVRRLLTSVAVAQVELLKLSTHPPRSLKVLKWGAGVIAGVVAPIAAAKGAERGLSIISTAGAQLSRRWRPFSNSTTRLFEEFDQINARAAGAPEPIAGSTPGLAGGANCLPPNRGAVPGTELRKVIQPGTRL